MDAPDFAADHFFSSVQVCLPKSHENCIIGERNQEGTDSCYAFVVVSCIYADFCINKGKGVKASEQLLIDCLHLKYAHGQTERKPGSGFTNTYGNALRYIKEKGIFLDKDYPWRAKLKKCWRDKASVDSVIFIQEYKSSDSVVDAVNWLDSSHFVAGSIYIVPKLRTWIHTKCIYTLSDDDEEWIKEQRRQKKKLLRHAIALVGYGEEEGIHYFLAQNSSGLAFGHKGFFKVNRECVMSFFCVEGSWVKPNLK